MDQSQHHHPSQNSTIRSRNIETSTNDDDVSLTQTTTNRALVTTEVEQQHDDFDGYDANHSEHDIDCSHRTNDDEEDDENENDDCSGGGGGVRDDVVTIIATTTTTRQEQRQQEQERQQITTTGTTTTTTTTTKASKTTPFVSLALSSQRPENIPTKVVSSVSSITSNVPTTTTTTTTNSSVFGPIQSAVVVLRNYGNYGLSERIVYHFNLLQQQQSSSSQSLSSSSLLLSSQLKKKSNPNNDMSVTSMTNNNTNMLLSTSSSCSSTMLLHPSLSASLSSIPETTTTTATVVEMTATTTSTMNSGVLPNDTTTATNTNTMNTSSPHIPTTKKKSYGVIQLLECLPTRPWHKFTRRQRKDFKIVVRQFNNDADNDDNSSSGCCSSNNNNENNYNLKTDPSSPPLPFILHSQTRLYTTYETTRIVYIIDASSTMTNSTDSMLQQQQQSNSAFLCPIDRLVQMSKTFFTSLVEPIVTSSHTNYQPEFAVTVIAVYPINTPVHHQQDYYNQSKKCTSILVRDYSMKDPMHADVLCRSIEEFCYTEIENEIAFRMTPIESSHPTINGKNSSRSSSSSSSSSSNSSMSNMIDAAYVALSSLSDHGRPLIVIGTDCCCVQDCCGDNSMVGMTNMEQHQSTIKNLPLLDDIPIIVLDASSPLSHKNSQSMSSSDSVDSNVWDTINSVPWVHDDSTYPLHLSDDSIDIYQLCQSTGGTFWDEELLQMGATTRAGQVDSNSVFNQDYYFAFRKHTSIRKHSIQPNAIQWYTLFQLSPLSPRTQDDWGKLPPPRYMSKLLQTSTLDVPAIGAESPPPMMDSTIRRQSMYHDTITIQQQRGLITSQHSCVPFLNYIINPIPIHEILLLRVKEGYCAKQYGQSNMSDGDRISILFTLSLYMDITIRYELSFKAHPSTLDDKATLSIGSAHIKIELAGDTDLVWIIKKQYLSHPVGAGQENQSSPPTSTLQQISTRICTYLRSIRNEDLLQSYLSPIKWTDQLSSATTPFVRRLGTLSSFQRRSHFCRNEFDCICVGHMPWDDDDFLSEFRDDDDGSQHLIDAVETWSTQTIIVGSRYVKETHLNGGVAGYAIISIIQSSIAPRLYTVAVETFSGMSAHDRQNLLKSIHNVIKSLHTVEILPKQFCKSLVVNDSRRGVGVKKQFSQSVMESLQNHVSWDLVKDPELTSLLMKRRKEIGKFVLLESGESYGSFARIFDNEKHTDDGQEDPGNLSQYHFSVLDDKVVVHLYMEYESGTFFPYRNGRSQQRCPSMFHRLEASLKKRDQECGHALRCRTMLLQPFDATTRLALENDADLYCVAIQKLMGYSSKVTVQLRFYQSRIDEANNILHSLTRESLLLQSFGPKVAELPVLPSVAVTEYLDDGNWFIVEYDKYTASIIYLSKKNKSIAEHETGFPATSTCRDLTFFTFGTTDLYNRRDDIEDDVMDDDHISEHLQVSEFCESIQNIHEQNYAYAAYLSLATTESPAEDLISAEDVSEVMKMLDFVKVGQVTIDLDDSLVHSHDPANFFAMFESILHPLPFDSCSFHVNCNNLRDFAPVIDERINNQVFEYTDEEHKSLCSYISEEAKHLHFKDLIADDAMSELEATHEDFAVAVPTFVRFLLNDVPLSASNVDQIENNSTISVHISIFNEKTTGKRIANEVDLSKLPSSHLSPSTILSYLLDAYVAELTLDQLLLRGVNLQDSDVRQAKVCMQNASNVLTCKVDLFFYSRTSDAIVKASELHILGLEVDVAFDLFVTGMKEIKSYLFRSFDSGYLLECFDNESNELALWCFVQIERVEGRVNIEVYHPGGLEKAIELIELVVDDITCCCHRVNQLLLLRSLNETRIASKLLISGATGSHRGVDVVNMEGVSIQFQDGYFGCPIAYETSFELFHRFAANPAKVVRSLEAYVLQNFAVSNQPEVFVYKDENGSIFYMKLKLLEPKTVATSSNTNVFGEYGCIDLVVYGIGVPGSSITKQLRRLLHKHILSIAIEMLSTVLTKNPRYHWRQLDIRFIKSFNAQAKDEDESNAPLSSDSNLYAFPASTYDPGMVALFFRQNLCGSTYFHPLLTSEWEGSWTHDEIPAGSSSADRLQLQPTDLLFYYNTSSSDLDPSLQSESTLTSKGSRYSAQTGTGLAVIEVSLLNRKGRPLQQMKAAIPALEVSDTYQNSIKSLTFDSVNESCDGDDSANEFYDGDEMIDVPVFIRVKISDTALRTDILHRWILLSLNQALMAWNIERQLERTQNGLKSPFDMQDCVENGWKLSMENVCLGLPIFVGILEVAHKLPHPTAQLVEYVGVVRSSVVASVVLDFLEKVILDQIQTATRCKLIPDKHYKLQIVRSSRSSCPQIVVLERDCAGRVVVRGATDQTRQRPTIIDSPIDCPEYSVFFYSPDYSIWNEKSQRVVYPKLFREVAVGYEKSGEKGDFAKLLFDFKQQHISSFQRSIAFVFSVKRNRRRLLTYNWSNMLFKRTATRLDAMEDILQQSTIKSVQTFHHRCLSALSPISNGGGATTGILKHATAPMKDNVPKHATAPTKDSGIFQPDLDRSSAIRQSLLPPTIRRPKLVGKSIEGSAVQAVVKSRARASATRYKGIAQSSTPTTQRKHISTKMAAQSSIKSLVENTTNKSSSKQVGNNEEGRRAENGDFLLIRKEFERSIQCHGASQSTIRSIVGQQISKKYWPWKSKKAISQSLVDFIFSMAPISWIDVSVMLPFPVAQSEEFLQSFGNTLTTFYPELSAVHVPGTQDTFWLSGKPRNLKSCRGLLAIRISLSSFPGNGKNDYVVQLEGRLLILPRQHKICLYSNSTLENVSAGFDKLASDMRKLLSLQGQLLDHCAFTIERTMKSSTTTQDYDRVVSALPPLIDLFPLRKVIKTIHSKYKCYKANIVLSSYADPIISGYNGIEMYNWLSSHISSTNLISCGASGLCFKKIISLNATQSICFLKYDDKQLGHMCLYILCRTQGRDLYDYMFREGSNVAVTIFSNIAIEAAGLAYVELRSAAFNLRRDTLWKSLLTSRNESTDRVYELLSLCTITPLNKLLVDDEEFNRLVATYNDPILFDSNRFCVCLSNDPAFSLTWQSTDSDGIARRQLYYIQNDDFYLMVSTFVNGVQQFQLELIERTNRGDIDQRTIRVVQKIVNFLLYFLWSETGN